MTTLIGLGALGLSAVMLVAGVRLVAVRAARTTSDRFWIGLLVLQIELSMVAVACSLMHALEMRTVLVAQVVLLAGLVLLTRRRRPRGLAPPSCPEVPALTGEAGGRGIRPGESPLPWGLPWSS